MGLMQLKYEKETHKKYLQKQLKKTNDEDEITKLYLKTCINIIDKELNGKEIPIIQYDKLILSKLLELGFDEINSLVFAYLFENDSVQAGKLNEVSGIDRGKIYRSLDWWIERNVVGKVSGSITEFYILDKQNPLQFIIEDKKLTILSLEKFHESLITITTKGVSQ